MFIFVKNRNLICKSKPVERHILPFVWLYDVRVLVYDGKIFLVTTTCSHSTRSVVGTAVPSTTRKSLKKNNTPSRVPVFLFVDACVYNNLYIYM